MDDDDDRGPAPTGFVGGAIPEGARRAATPQAVREWVEQVSQQLARDERRQRDEARETIKRQELRRRRPTTRSQTAATAAQPEEGDQCRICFSGPRTENSSRRANVMARSATSTRTVPAEVAADVRWDSQSQVLRRLPRAV